MKDPGIPPGGRRSSRDRDSHKSGFCGFCTPKCSLQLPKGLEHHKPSVPAAAAAPIECSAFSRGCRGRSREDE